MTGTVADTHSILWYLFEPRLLSAAADAEMTAAAAAHRLFISAITLVEVIYQIEKKKFPYPDALEEIYSFVGREDESVSILPVTRTVAQAVARVPRSEVPDMPDRIVSATAVAHSFKLVSADTDIRNSATLNALITVVW